MKRVSIILQYNDQLNYSDSELNETIESLINQNYTEWELILVDERGGDASYPAVSKHEKITHLTGNFKNRAQALNSALKKIGMTKEGMINAYFSKRQRGDKTLEQLYFTLLNDMFTIRDYYIMTKSVIDTFYERESSPKKASVAKKLYDMLITIN